MSIYVFGTSLNYRCKKKLDNITVQIMLLPSTNPEKAFLSVLKFWKWGASILKKSNFEHDRSLVVKVSWHLPWILILYSVS